jgi:hypothetical protein
MMPPYPRSIAEEVLYRSLARMANDTEPDFVDSELRRRRGARHRFGAAARSLMNRSFRWFRSQK